MNGSASDKFMYDTAVALARAMPDAQHRILEGQTHAVAPEAIAPVLVEFFNGADGIGSKKTSRRKATSKGK
jgi:hypothetical protein